MTDAPVARRRGRAGPATKADEGAMAATEGREWNSKGGLGGAGAVRKEEVVRGMVGWMDDAGWRKAPG